MSTKDIFIPKIYPFFQKIKKFITDLVKRDILSHMYFERTNTE